MSSYIIGKKLPFPVQLKINRTNFTRRLLSAFSRATNELFQVALRRQQAQEESEARELGLQLQYNTGSCTTAPVLPAAAGATPAGSPPPHPAHVASPAGLGIPAAAAAAAAAAAVHIQSQLQHQPAECGLLPRKRSTQDEYRQPKVEKSDPVVGKRIALLLSIFLLFFIIFFNCTLKIFHLIIKEKSAFFDINFRGRKCSLERGSRPQEKKVGEYRYLARAQ